MEGLQHQVGFSVLISNCYFIEIRLCLSVFGNEILEHLKNIILKFSKLNLENWFLKSIEKWNSTEL